MKITVIADIFSGRPNPEWKATKDEEEAILCKCAQVRAYHSNRRMRTGLGYRGFIVLWDGFPVFEVCDHVIKVGEAHLTDDGLEEMLLAHADAHGYGEVIRRSKGEEV